MTREEFLKEYKRLGHALQTGVATMMQMGDAGASPKHLRTGLNISMCDHASMIWLLLKKGIITEEEYQEAILEGLEREKAEYEKVIGYHLGGKSVTLE